jgi:ABC-2 type transport system ATP-binding protein
MDATISVTDLTKRFGDFTAVNQINLEVFPGEIFGFLGPNGSGKTTTIRMMLGLLKPTAGFVEVLGMSIQQENSRIRPQVGYMSQRFSLYNDLTVLQNLNFYGSAYGLDESLLQQRIQNALEMSGLSGRGKSLTRDLSGGWRQRLALSAAILHRPKILFLDEPTAGVDPISRRAFWDLLYQLISEGITVFVTTHYMDEAEHCHRLAFIQRGEIIAYGSPMEIKGQWMQGQVLELSPSTPIKTVKILRAAQQAGTLPIDEVELYGTLVHVVGVDLQDHLAAIKSELQQAGIEPGQVAFIEPSLEDVFIACMRR